LDPSAIEAALHIEALKWGSRAIPVVIHDLGGCANIASGPADIVAQVQGGPALVIQAGAGQPERLDLSEVPPEDRAAETARLIVAEFTPSTPARSAELVPEDLVLPTPEVAPEPPSAPTLVAGAAWLHGGWMFSPANERHEGRLGGEFAITAWQERASLGVAGHWIAAQSTDTSRGPVTTEGGDLLFTIRGGWFWGTFGARLGVGVGAEWLRVEFAPNSRLGVLSERWARFLLLVEPEALWQPTPLLRVSLAVPLRVVPATADQTWTDARVWSDAPFAVGTEVRVGVVF
jgi:hypothetical protein